jgi:hypothetical protein
LHRFFDEKADQLFAANIGRFNRQEEAHIAALNDAIPFKESH